MTLRAPFATAIGSLPLTDPIEAVDLVLESFPEAPCWPQLPKRSWLENMDAQYAEGLPCLREDPEKAGVAVLTEGQGIDQGAELERFWAPMVSGVDDPERLGISAERAPGFFELLCRFEVGAVGKRSVLKGQVTGPVTFGMMVKTLPSGRQLLYEPAFFEAARALLAAKAGWQMIKLRPFADEVLIFMDEPGLVSFGSAFLPLGREEVVSWLDEVALAVHREGGLAGTHCCGNTDWSLLMGSSLDVINFDANEHFDNVMLYAGEVAAFLERGGLLAFGIVPTGDAVLALAPDQAAATLEDQIARLGREVGWPRSRLLERLMVTPACGLGSRTEEQARRAMAMCQAIVDRLGA